MIAFTRDGHSIRRSYAHQRGAGLLSVLFVVGALGLVVVIGGRLAPVYLEAWTVRSVMNSLRQETGLRGASRQEIAQSLSRRLTINDVRSVGRDDIEIREMADGTSVVIDYEVRIPLIGNLDGVAYFRYEAVIPQ